MVTITLSQAVEILNSVSGSTFLGTLRFVSARLKKGGRMGVEKNPYPNTMKLTKQTVLLNSEYAQRVQLQHDREEAGQYVAGVNTFKLDREENKAVGFCAKSGKPVLYYTLIEGNYPQTKYVNEGRLVSKSDIKTWLPTYSAPKTQDAIEKKVTINKMYLSNLRKFTLNGVTYKIVG